MRSCTGILDWPFLSDLVRARFVFNVPAPHGLHSEFRSAEPTPWTLPLLVAVRTQCDCPWVPHCLTPQTATTWKDYLPDDSVQQLCVAKRAILEDGEAQQLGNAREAKNHGSSLVLMVTDTTRSYSEPRQVYREQPILTRSLKEGPIHSTFVSRIVLHETGLLCPEADAIMRLRSRGLRHACHTHFNFQWIVVVQSRMLAMEV